MYVCVGVRENETMKLQISDFYKILIKKTVLYYTFVTFFLLYILVMLFASFLNGILSASLRVS